MAEIEKLNKKLKSLNTNLDKLDSFMDKLFSQNSVDELEQQISPMDSAKINMALAYFLNSLYFSNQISIILPLFL